MVLGAGADHGRPADVDIFDAIGKTGLYDDEVSFPVPDLWKKVGIPFSARGLEALNDPEAKNLQIGDRGIAAISKVINSIVRKPIFTIDADLTGGSGSARASSCSAPLCAAVGGRQRYGAGMPNNPRKPSVGINRSASSHSQIVGFSRDGIYDHDLSETASATSASAATGV
jgi:hypothetical protein